MTALKTLVITSTPASPNRELHPQLLSPTKAGPRKGHLRHKSTSSALCPAVCPVAGHILTPDKEGKEVRGVGQAVVAVKGASAPCQADSSAQWGPTCPPPWDQEPVLPSLGSVSSGCERQVSSLWYEVSDPQEGTGGLCPGGTAAVMSLVVGLGQAGPCQHLSLLV